MFFQKTMEKVRAYAPLFLEKGGRITDGINERGRDMNRNTALWICRAGAVASLLLAVFYIVNFFHKIL